jgi:hypothetical protein
MQRFTSAEIKFLLSDHTRVVETATSTRALNIRSTPILSAARDPRDIGMPQKMFEEMLERRAAAIAPEFSAFRAKHRATAPNSETDLDVAVAGGKLF